MKSSSHKVVVTGLGSYSAGFDSSVALYKGAIGGKSGIKPVFVEPLNGFFHLGATEPSVSFTHCLKKSLDEALNSASLSKEMLGDVFLCLGTTGGGICNTEENFFKKGIKTDIQRHVINWIFDELKNSYFFEDELAFSTACTSSGNALSFSKILISSGQKKIVVAGGVDMLCSTVITGFNSLGVLSKEKCRPFNRERTGMNIGEGSAFIVLESEESAKNRGAEIICSFDGAGCSSDAYQITAPSPNGIESSLRNALDDAGISPRQVGYINAHGTGTVLNDNAESAAIAQVFDNQTFYSSTKPVTGHLLGAASAIEAVLVVRSLVSGVFPANIGTENPIFPNVLTEVKEINTDYVLSHSSAFGGNNTSLIFGRYYG